MKDKWKAIEGYEGYLISDSGKVKCLKFKSERLLKPTPRGNGYLAICLCDKGIKKTLDIHRLVAQAFVSNPANKPCINHIDFDCMNNKAENLEWVTQYENLKHSSSYARVKWKLTYEEKKNIICECLENKETQKAIAKKYNIEPSVISRLFNRAKRGWLPRAI
jgi:hypothetical protein